MLIFTYKLEKWIKLNLLPKLLIKPGTYMIKGSFRRRIPYITDIDIVNNVYPEINGSNIYQELIKLISRLKTPEYAGIILVYVTCGVDNRFRIDTGSDEELAEIKNLLEDKDAQEFELVQYKYADDFDKKIFFISEIIWKYYKLRWTSSEVLSNSKKLRGGLVVKLTDEINKNSSLLLQYYAKISSYPVGIDIVINYEPVDMKNAYEAAASYQLKLANYSKEYYYMLFPFKHCFRDDPQISQELEDLIEKKFGLYKQLMVRIDSYHTLYITNNLDYKTAAVVVSTIMKDIINLDNFSSNIPKKSKQIENENISSDEKMQQWDTLLSVLYGEINASANAAAKEYFFKYLAMVPEDVRNKYCLIENEQSRIVRAKKYNRKYRKYRKYELY